MEGLLTSAKGICITLGAAICCALGGWDLALEFLLVAMGIDMVTGILSAFKHKRFKASRMWWGVTKKITALLIVGFAVEMDRATGLFYFRTATIWFYALTDGASILENAAELGIPIPRFITEGLETIRGQMSPGEPRSTPRPPAGVNQFLGGE